VRALSKTQNSEYATLQNEIERLRAKLGDSALGDIIGDTHSG